MVASNSAFLSTFSMFRGYAFAVAICMSISPLVMAVMTAGEAADSMTSPSTSMMSFEFLRMFLLMVFRPIPSDGGFFDSLALLLILPQFPIGQRDVFDSRRIPRPDSRPLADRVLLH